ncbi:MAG TPA: glycosyltransferase family 2 protein [Vicinamibacteria bacterium]|nr:glycosyltransferase family 2 protein [Vicinamibacteria bacterium]
MKLVVQIPCRDEEESLPRTLAELPRAVPPFETVEWVLVDDGSVDHSVEVALAGGVDEVVSLPGPRGLSSAFLAGLEAALRRGADVVVNTDADNQYCGADVARLVAPIVEGRADMVIGERPRDAAAFSPGKRWLQRLGSAVVRRLSGTAVPDATSGFRAYSREAALQVNLFSRFSYTLETIIQLGLRRARIASVEVRVNPVSRPSRLYRSVPEFVLRQALTILRILVIYRPFEVFAWPGALFFLLGLVPGVRFLLLYVRSGGQGHVQSLILCAILLSVGALLLLTGTLASVIAANRILLEDVRIRLRRLESAEPEPALGGSPTPRAILAAESLRAGRR